MQGSVYYIRLGLCCTVVLASMVYLPTLYPSITWPWLAVFLLGAGLVSSFLCLQASPQPNVQAAGLERQTAQSSSAQQEGVQAKNTVHQRLACKLASPAPRSDMLAAVDPDTCPGPQVRQDTWTGPQVRQGEEAFGRVFGREAARNGVCSTVFSKRPTSVPEDGLGEGLVNDWDRQRANESVAGREAAFTGLASFAGWSDGDACSITDTSAELSTGQLNSIGSSGFGLGLNIPFMKSQDLGGEVDCADAVQGSLDGGGCGDGREAVLVPRPSFDLAQGRGCVTNGDPASVANTATSGEELTRVVQNLPYVSKVSGGYMQAWLSSFSWAVRSAGLFWRLMWHFNILMGGPFWVGREPDAPILCQELCQALRTDAQFSIACAMFMTNADTLSRYFEHTENSLKILPTFRQETCQDA